MKDPKKVNQGKINRAKGALFERRVRSNLETNGWIVHRSSNNVDLEKQKMVPAKSNKYNLRTCGFPDFVCIKPINPKHYNVIGVEVKSNGYLDKIEREKCGVLLKNKVFSKIYIASRDDKKIKYTLFTQ